MSALRPLIALLEQAEIERDQALAQRQRAMTQLQGAQTQAQQLQVYRTDYAERYSPQLKRASTPDILRCYGGFMSRLQLAIDQQDQTVRQWQASSEKASKTLAQHELRVASVRKLIERRQQELVARQDQHERKAGDEHAMRSALRNRPAFAATRF